MRCEAALEKTATPVSARLGLAVLGHVGGQSGEGHPAALGDGLDVQLLDLPVQGLLLERIVLDLQDLAQLLPFRPLGGVEPADLEIGVVLQQLDEPLSDHSRRAQHRYLYLLHHSSPKYFLAFLHDPDHVGPVLVQAGLLHLAAGRSISASSMSRLWGFRCWIS